MTDNGEEPTGDESEAEPLLALRAPDGSALLRVERDGTAVFSPDAQLDELSRQFWQSVAGQQGVLAEVRESLTVYVSGPMEGIPNYNIPTYRSAANLLRQGGYNVVDITQVEGFSRFDAGDGMVRLRLAALLRCNAVALLPGWHQSFTSQKEIEVATWCGMTVAPVDYWLVGLDK